MATADRASSGGFADSDLPVSNVSELQIKLGGKIYGLLQGVVEGEDELLCLYVGLGAAAIVCTEKGSRSSFVAKAKQELADKWFLNRKAVVKADAGVLRALVQHLKSPDGRVIRLDDIGRVVYQEIVETAVSVKTSDIHCNLLMENGDFTTAEVRLRYNGRVNQWFTMQGRLAAEMWKKVFSMSSAGTNSASQFSFTTDLAFMVKNEVGGQRWEGRFNGRPHATGYKAVQRLINTQPKIEDIPSLGELGYTDSHVRMINRAAATGAGVFFVIGSTGSGKTTTLRTVLTKVRDPMNSIIMAVESPTEYIMPGVVQCSVNVNVNDTPEEIERLYTSALRSVVRMDPDELMVGEVRDKQSGRLALEFGLTGHPSYTTFHGNGVIDGLNRLTGGEIQMDASSLAGESAISACVYQRLLPVLCGKCRIPATSQEGGLPEEKRSFLRSVYGLDAGSMFVARKGGCPNCRPKVPGLPAHGTVGVTVAAEVMIPNEKIRAAVARSDWPAATAAWRSQSNRKFGDPDMTGKTAFENGLYLVSKGTVSLHDLEESFQPIEVYAERNGLIGGAQ